LINKTSTTTNILYIAPRYPQSLQKIVFQLLFNIKSLDFHQFSLIKYTIHNERIHN